MKRLLLFLLLLAVGFAVLHFAVDDDRPATAGAAPSAERQVPQGGVSCSVSATITRSVKSRSPSDKAFQIATRSAQTVKP